MSAPAYDRITIVLHWIVGLAILGQFALGWWVGSLPDEPASAGWVGLHQWIGVTLAAFVVLRLLWRLSHPTPELPGTLPRLQRTMAKATHWALYGCMVVMPLSGYLSTWGSDDADLQAAMGSVHSITASLLGALLALHVGAAVWHLARRDGLFARMWPSVERR